MPASRRARVLAFLALSCAGTGCLLAQPAPEGDGPLPRLTLDEIYTLAPATEGKETLTTDEIKAFLADPASQQPFVPAAPVGLEDLEPHIPADNPMTRAKVELGRMLYFDPRLSRDGTVSCATCHDPAHGWAEPRPVSTGIKAQQGARNAPTVMNRVFGKTQFWDGRAASLEEQALGPVQNPIEMGFTLEEMVGRLKEIEGYRMLFDKVFGEITSDGVARAIAAFERTVVVGGAPNDYEERAAAARDLDEEDWEDLEPELVAELRQRLADAEAHPLDASARRGRELYFGKASCSLCHVGVNLTDEAFYNLGVGMDAEKPDLGRSAISEDEADTGAFKTPSLRNIADSPPYMHDGSVATLEDTVLLYVQGGEDNPHLSDRIQPLDLTDEEVADLVHFLEVGLTGDRVVIPRPRLP